MTDNSERPIQAGDMVVVRHGCQGCTCKAPGYVFTVKRLVHAKRPMCNQGPWPPMTEPMAMVTENARFSYGFPVSWCTRIKPDGETGTQTEHWEKPAPQPEETKCPTPLTSSGISATATSSSTQLCAGN